MSFRMFRFPWVAFAWLATAGFLPAQQVILPTPRLLTVFPIGGQAGTTVEVTVTGENLDDLSELQFSTSKVTAQLKPAKDGKAQTNRFLVTIAADAPAGVHDARVMTRLGASTARAFTVGRLPETSQLKTNNTLESALELKPNSVCNAVMTRRSVDFYSFPGTKGKRVVLDCATAGIDSKLAPVLIVADGQGRDLVVDRLSGCVEFTPPADGKYHVKVHGLTFQGGADCFYRLQLQEAPGTGVVPRQATTKSVSSFSWQPEANWGIAQTAEVEPNNQHAQAQKITLPCDLTGRFYPAADVDTFEFTAKKGETWWVEVASERLGLPTDPFILVQRVTQENGKEKLSDVAELNDIPSPMKPSSNGYSYDGPPYDAGSADVLGKLEIKEDGQYRLQLRDLFGGTRTDPRNAYRLVIRKAAPDFALVAWALHINLRNGDRNAQSKPITLRGGTTMPLEVAVVRRDGFDGEIELGMEGLPAGVTAAGLKIPAGKSQGLLLVTAADDAPRAFALGRLFGRALVNSNTVTRPCQLASMAWPVRDSVQEIPRPRLMADVPVSVGGAEVAPVSVTAMAAKVWEAKATDKLTIPLKAIWRGELTGSLKLRAYGAGFTGMKEFEIPVGVEKTDAVLDLAALKAPPGDHTIAFYCGYVTKYRPNPAPVKLAESELKKAEAEAASLSAAAKKLAEEATAAPAERKAAMDEAAKAALDKQKAAEAAKAEATRRMKLATDATAPRDIADILVSEPIRIRIQPAETDKK